MYVATLQDWMELVHGEYSRGEIRADEMMDRLAAYVTVSVSMGKKFNAVEFISPFTEMQPVRFTTSFSDREVPLW